MDRLIPSTRDRLVSSIARYQGYLDTGLNGEGGPLGAEDRASIAPVVEVWTEAEDGSLGPVAVEDRLVHPRPEADIGQELMDRTPRGCRLQKSALRVHDEVAPDTALLDHIGVLVEPA